MAKTFAEHMNWTRHHWTLMFFFCLLIALFVTVCIYTYAGQQQNLGTRNFSNVVINGVDTMVTDLVTDVEEGATLSFDKNTKKSFFFEASGEVQNLVLPSKAHILESFPKKTNGVIVSLGTIFNNQSGFGIDVTFPDGITIKDGAGTHAVSAQNTATLDFLYKDGDLIWYP